MLRLPNCLAVETKRCQLTTTSNGGLDEGIQLLVSTDGQLQVTGGDTFYLLILTGVT